MKEFGKFFARPYNTVSSTDDEQQQQQFAELTPNNANAAIIMQRAASLAEKQRRKSLKANRSMNPAGILSSFFNERQTNKRARSPKCAFLLLAIGVLAITTAVLVKIFQPYDLIFKWKLTMSEDGEIFNLWAKPPVDLYIKIYLFNITNAEAFLAGREKMRVEQVGPYVYKEIMTHENITFNANNTMSTNPSHPLVWQEHMSEGHKEDDEVVMLNIAMLAISHLTASKSYFVRMMLNGLFHSSNSQPLVRMTAKQFMFGYPSSLTTLGNTFLPNWISFEKVGLIDRMYDFASDFETFHTGVPDPSISGLYATYRGETNLPQWQGDHCSNIELASDGTKFKSFLQPNDSVKFFRKSMCRPINLYRVGEAEKYGSLSGYKYVFEDNAFDNGAINEANKCFCRNGKCQPQGLIDVTDCYYGFPISLSYPHFMDGEPGLQNNVTGLAPSKENHSSAFVIQPQSGLPLSLSVKVQINMHFNDMQGISKAARFSHLTAPMLWFEIMMPKLPDSLDTRFNFYLNLLPYIDTLGYWGGLALGVALLVYAVTRATLRMSSFAQGSGISDDCKYGKANLLRSHAVYNPCEMKLIQTNEKPQQPQLPPAQHIITRQVEDEVTEMYNEIDLSKKRHSSFALELEPAISASDSSDEGNDSDTATISRNSTSCSSCLDVHGEDDSASANSSTRVGKNTRCFGSSSGFESHNDTNSAPSVSSSQSGGAPSASSWSSLVENAGIGNNNKANSAHASASSSRRVYQV